MHFGISQTFFVCKKELRVIKLNNYHTDNVDINKSDLPLIIIVKKDTASRNVNQIWRHYYDD